jgi:hypothetical protein
VPKAAANCIAGHPQAERATSEEAEINNPEESKSRREIPAMKNLFAVYEFRCKCPENPDAKFTAIINQQCGPASGLVARETSFMHRAEQTDACQNAGISFSPPEREADTLRA